MSQSHQAPENVASADPSAEVEVQVTGPPADKLRVAVEGCVSPVSPSFDFC